MWQDSNFGRTNRRKWRVFPGDFGSELWHGCCRVFMPNKSQLSEKFGKCARFLGGADLGKGGRLNRTNDWRFERGNWRSCCLSWSQFTAWCVHGDSWLSRPHQLYDKKVFESHVIGLARGRKGNVKNLARKVSQASLETLGGLWKEVATFGERGGSLVQHFGPVNLRE